MERRSRGEFARPDPIYDPIYEGVQSVDSYPPSSMGSGWMVGDEGRYDFGSNRTIFNYNSLSDPAIHDFSEEASILAGVPGMVKGLWGLGIYGLERAGLSFAANNGGRLIHLTDEAGEAGIAASNSLRGNHGIFAVPSSVAAESTALKVARTGVMPAQTTNFVNIPEAATSLFTRPVPVGPYSALKYFGGVRYAPSGSLNMSTGVLTPGGSMIGPRTVIYGPDALFYGGGAAASGSAYYYRTKQ